MAAPEQEKVPPQKSQAVFLPFDAEFPDPPSKPTRGRVFFCNLALVIVIGMAVTWWLVNFTTSFAEFGSALALGGVLSWVAFVLRVVPDDAATDMRALVIKGAEHRMFTVAVLVIVVVLVIRASASCAIHIETAGGSAAQTAWIYFGKLTDEDRLHSFASANETTVLLGIPTGANPSWNVKMTGMPMMHVSVGPFRHPTVHYPDSFKRRVLLVYPEPQLIKVLKAEASLPTFKAYRNGKPFLTIQNYGFYPFWIGCARDVQLPPGARSVLAEEVANTDYTLASAFLLAQPLSDPAWYTVTDASGKERSWDSAEVDIESTACWEVELYIGERRLGRNEVELSKRSSEFAQVVALRYKDYGH